MSQRVGVSGFPVLVAVICVVGSAAYLFCRAHKSTPDEAYVLTRDAIKVNTQDVSDRFKKIIENGLLNIFPAEMRLKTAGGQGVDMVRALLKKSGWVLEVQEVEITEKGTLKAKVFLKNPYAWLETREGCVLVDKTGSPLPLKEPIEEAARSGLLIIRGADTASRIGAALSLCEIIYRNETLLLTYGVRFLFLERTDGGRYNLVSTDGRVFEWGYPPAGATVSYLTVKEKLENLVMVLKNPFARSTKRAVLWTRIAADLQQPSPQQ